MPPPLRTFGLAAAAALAAAHASPDAEALLQFNASLEPLQPCRCLAWQDIYKEHGAKCGDAMEVIPWTDAEPGPKSLIISEKDPAELQEKICKGFYLKLFGRFCANLHPGTERMDQWCYVSTDCDKLNGGGRAGNEGLQWKICTPKADLLSNWKPPELLMNIAKRQNKDAALIMQMSYPTYTGGLTWQDVKKCVKDSNTQDCEEFRRIRAKRLPMIFSPANRTSPLGIVRMKSVVEVRPTAAHVKRAAGGKKLDVLDGFNSEFEYLVGSQKFTINN